MKLFKQSILAQNESFRILQCAETITSEATVFMFDSNHLLQHWDNSVHE